MEIQIRPEALDLPATHSVTVMPIMPPSGSSTADNPLEVTAPKG